MKTGYFKNCEICGIEFRTVPSAKKQFCCSPKCSGIRRIKGKNKCLDCGNPTSTRKAKRCRKCHDRFAVGENANNWIDGRRKRILSDKVYRNKYQKDWYRRSPKKKMAYKYNSKYNSLSTRLETMPVGEKQSTLEAIKAKRDALAVSMEKKKTLGLPKKELAKTLKAYQKRLDSADALIAATEKSLREVDGVNIPTVVADFESYTEPIAGLTMIQLPGGTYTMGGVEDKDDNPSHQVTVGAVQFAETAITQKQLLAIIKKHPYEDGFYAEDENAPADRINWYEAVDYCKQLSLLSEDITSDVKEAIKDLDAEAYLQYAFKNRKARLYRLPTEAEWEYAARAGTDTTYYWDKDIDKIDDFAIQNKGSQDNKSAQPVKQKKPNQWGLYGMIGNVWEWCIDWYSDSFYKEGEKYKDPLNTSKADYRVLRGGSWDHYYGDEYFRSACRHRTDPGRHFNDYGFRLVRTVEMNKKKMANQVRQSLKKGGGILKKQTIQLLYEDNIKKYGTLTCYLCDKSIEFGKDSLEHKMPLSRGGSNNYENLAVAHRSCNSRKHNKTLKEYREVSKN